jgi:hypothetical protein
MLMVVLVKIISRPSYSEVDNLDIIDVNHIKIYKLYFRSILIE